MNIISLIRFSLLIVNIQFFRNNWAAVKAPNYEGPKNVKRLIKHLLLSKYTDKTQSFEELVKYRGRLNIWADIFGNETGLPLECKKENIELDIGQANQPDIIEVSTFYCSENLRTRDIQQHYIMKGFFTNSVITVKRVYNQSYHEPQSLWYLTPNMEKPDAAISSFEELINDISEENLHYQFSRTSRLNILKKREATALCQLSVGLSENILSGNVQKDFSGPITYTNSTQVHFPRELKLVLYCVGKRNNYIGIQDLDSSILLSKYTDTNEIIFEKSLFGIGILDKLVSEVNKEVFGYESPLQSTST